MISRKETSKNIFRVLVFVLERFGAHELANHAAAGAYAFLLSATPAFLLVLGLSRAILARYPGALTSVADFSRELLGPLGAAGVADSFFSRPLGIVAAALAALSLVWAARLFVVSVQRGLRVVWGGAPQFRPVKENILTFSMELVCLAAAAVILGMAQMARLFVARLEPVIGVNLAYHIGTLIKTAPALLLLVFSYASFRMIPQAKPSKKTAFLSAALCLILYASFSALLRFSLDRSRYDLLYGVFGNLIILLANVYIFFTIYYYCAELVYVLERYDSLLLSRFLKVSHAEAAGKIDKALFGRPERLISGFGREYPAGSPIFLAGDESREAYYLVSGEVGVYIAEGGKERRIATIHEGEFFGEMAGLLDESRTATTRAESDALAVVLPPSLFEGLLASDLDASKRMIALLSERLRRNNLNVLAGETAASESVAVERNPPHA